jgi:hypothetical protein
VSYRLEPCSNLRRRARHIARTQIERAIEATRDERCGTEDTVHSVRRSTKKVRALVRLFRGSLPRAARRESDACLVLVAERFAAARDARVLLQTLESVESVLGQQAFDADRELWLHLRESSRTSNREAIDEQVPEVDRDLDAALRSVRRWKIERRGWGAVKRGLTHDYRRVRRRLAAVRRDPSNENLHALRKALKTHAYQIRLLSAPAGRGRRLGELDRISEQLGSDHDLALLHGALLADSTAAGARQARLLEAVDRRRRELRRRSLDRASRLFSEPPLRFRRRIRARWRARRHPA